jgi:transposase
MTVVGSVMAPSNISDISLTEPTINSIPKDVTTRKSRNLSYLVADKGYSSYNLSERLQTNHNIRLVAPVKSKHRPSNKTCTTILGRKLLQKRHVVENTMSNLKRFKRIRTREDGLIKSYDAFFYLGLSRL